MTIHSKLFVSHVGVAIISVLFMGILATSFSDSFLVYEEIDHIAENANSDSTTTTQEITEISRGSLSSLQVFLLVLTVAGMISIVLSAGISWFMSQRIVVPLRNLAEASQIIGHGHYEQRLDITSNDEIGELSAQFNAMAEALNNIEQTRRRLLADVSHEFRTPLTTIKGYIEALQDGVADDTAQTYELIYVEASRLQRLVHDLQILAQAEAGSPQLDLKSCDLSEILRTSVARLQSQYDAKTIRLTHNLSPEPIILQGDSQRLEQVFINILGNALQYTPDNSAVEMKVLHQTSGVQVAIQDNGIGIPPTELTHIFQRFYRVDPSRSRLSGGSGIGLTIAQHIVEAHAGKIWAESAGLGQGTRFYIELPTSSKLHSGNTPAS